MKDLEANRNLHNSLGFVVEVNPGESSGPLCDRFLGGEAMPCFLGLSPETSFSNRDRLTAILKWLAPRATTIVILEGTYFSRWDAIVFDHLSHAEAADRALKRSQRIHQRIAEVASRLGVSDRVRPLEWPTILEDSKVVEIQKILRNYASTTKEFLEDIDVLVDAFLERSQAATLGELRSENRDLLRNYVFEELSIFIHLASTGYSLEVYPGSDLEIMVRIGLGEYPHFPFKCPNRSHVSIRLLEITER